MRSWLYWIVEVQEKEQCSKFCVPCSIVLRRKASLIKKLDGTLSLFVRKIIRAIDPLKYGLWFYSVGSADNLSRMVNGNFF